MKKLLIAEKSGINSLKQLMVFLLHSKNNTSLSDATGLSPNEAGYKAHYGIVRKLMEGDKCRNRDSLSLLKFEENSKQSKVILTSKGKTLLANIEFETD